MYRAKITNLPVLTTFKYSVNGLAMFIINKRYASGQLLGKEILERTEVSETPQMEALNPQWELQESNSDGYWTEVATKTLRYLDSDNM